MVFYILWNRTFCSSCATSSTTLSSSWCKFHSRVLYTILHRAYVDHGGSYIFVQSFMIRHFLYRNAIIVSLIKINVIRVLSLYYFISHTIYSTIYLQCNVLPHYATLFYITESGNVIIPNVFCRSTKT